MKDLEIYIQKARDRGMTTETILKELLGVGWQLNDIVEVVMGRIPAPVAGDADTIISVEHVSKNYGAVEALKDISLTVRRGSVTALLGPNGAGKTTLVRILATLLAPTSGRATVSGYDVVDEAESLRRVIGLAGQYAAVDEKLTGRENLEMVGRLYHFDKHTSRARAVELLAQFDLTEAADRTLKTYSGGMRRRLDLAASLVAKPHILFLDEPTTGLDPRSRFQLWDVIRALVEGGTTVLLTTQYLEEADQLADQIFVIDHGGIIASGTSNELKDQAGGDILELHMTNHHDATEAMEALRELGQGEPVASDDTGVLTMPVVGGTNVMVEAVRALDTRGIKISDITLRRPSLDDVFMKLTGHAADEKKFEQK